MRRYRETHKQTFRALHSDKNSPWSRVDDESIEALEAVEREFGGSPDNIMEILTNMMYEEYLDSSYNLGPYMGEYVAHDLMLSNVITLDEYIQILKLLRC